MSVDGILERLLALHPKKIDLILDRMHRLLAAVGHPERQLPPVIHVAGTNGKGSVTAFLRAMAEAAGLRVHVYTSPHLVRFNERIRLSGKLISDDALQALLNECEAANEGAPITFFEITTVAALLAFARQPADLLLLEVGLGGRLDATNVIDTPLASVITPVSLDHLEFLGSELTGIAAEKAGIIKPSAAAIIGKQEPEALAVMVEKAIEVGAPIVTTARDWQTQLEGDGWVYSDSAGPLRLPMPGLAGAHQIDNAALAITAMRQSGLPVSDDHIATGIAATRWPARMQKVDAPELGDELYIDGGHNPAAAKALAVTLADMPVKPTRVIMGLLANRDITTFLEPLLDQITELWAVPMAGHDCHTPADMVAAAQAAGIDAQAFTDINAALDALRQAPYDGRVLIGGSLYLAGEALCALDQFPD